MNTTQFLLLGTVFVGSGLLAGCTSGGSITVTGEGTGPGGLSGKIIFEVKTPGPSTAKVTASEPVCLDFCYSDDAGTDLGCFTIEVPNEHDIPEGATKWSATIVDCPDGESAGWGGPLRRPQGGGLPDGQVEGWREWTMTGGPIQPATDGTTQASYRLIVTAQTLAQAKVLRDVVLAGGIGCVAPDGVRVLQFTESEAQLDAFGIPTGVLTRQALLNDDFASYELAINDHFYADLSVTGNLIQFNAGNGWNVVETLVSTQALDTSAKFRNKVSAAWSSIGTQESGQATLQVFTE